MHRPAATGVVITQWRDTETTRVCLKHVALLTPAPRVVVVVANECNDADVRLQMDQFPGVRFLSLPANTGHANAVNVGVTHVIECGCEYALLLDNDAFITPKSLQVLETALHAGAAAVAASPLILSGRRPGLVWYGGGRVSFLGNGVHEYMWRPPTAVPRTIREVGFLTACAMLMRCDAFSALGGFDASLVTYSDDLDLSLRLKQSGLSLLFVPSAEVTHGESVNVIKVAGKPFRDYYTMRNRLIVIRRHGTWLQKLLGIPLTIIWYGGVHAVVFLLRGEWRRSRALCRGTLDFMLGRSGMREV
jgi:GT2 family glycosyltransferase